MLWLWCCIRSSVIMNQTAKKKLCWSCEGRVTDDQENCPYCGVYLSPTPLHSGKGDPIVPLYAKNANSKEKKAPEPPFQVKEPKSQKEEAPVPSPVKASKEMLLPLMSLLSGAVFFLFGLVLLLFSDESGFLTLKWSSAFWPFYIGLSAILLFFGLRALNQINE